MTKAASPDISGTVKHMSSFLVIVCRPQRHVLVVAM
jgi:hypothetical protein